MELKTENLEQLAEEFETKGQQLQAQATKALKAAEHIRQVLNILDDDESTAEQENLPQTNVPVNGALARIVVETVYKTGGCHVSDICKAAIKADIGTKYSTPKAVYRMRDRGLIFSTKEGIYNPTAGMTLEDITFG